MAKQRNSSGFKLTPALKRILGFSADSAQDALDAARSLYEGAEDAIADASRTISDLNFRRLTPAEHKARNLKPSARHYVPKSVKRVTKRPPTITHRAHETLRTRREYGLAKPEIATEARQNKAPEYKSARDRETAEKVRFKAYEKRLHRLIENAAARGERIAKYAGPGERKPEYKTVRKGRRTYKTKTGFKARDWHADYVIDLRNRKVEGEELDDGDWHMMMDYAERFKDPARHLLRASRDFVAARHVAKPYPATNSPRRLSVDQALGIVSTVRR